MNNKEQRNAWVREHLNDRSYTKSQTTNTFITLINFTLKQISFSMNMRGFYAYLIALCISIFFINVSIATENVGGLHGYMGSYSHSDEKNSAYRYGMSLYSTVWPISNRLTKDMQIGLASSWLMPDNTDNITSPLCPNGTYARDDMPERGPTYDDVFQTIEGGLGIWAGTRFQTGYPKFAIGTVPNCYNDYSNTPGLQPGNFEDRPPMYGIVQLSNKLIVPPDGLPFKGKPNGELFGYGYLALPFTQEKFTDVPVGNLSWTLFVNVANFKGPVAFPIPDYWAELSKEYAFIEARGLDANKIRSGDSGTMEFGFGPALKAKDNKGDVYYKIPQIQFPMNNESETVLMQDLTFYSKDAMFNQFEHWKLSGEAANTKFDENGTERPMLKWAFSDFDIDNMKQKGIEESATPTIFDDNSFGLKWHIPAKNGMGLYPKYFKKEGDTLKAITENSLPDETNLKTTELPITHLNPEPYEVELNGLFSDHAMGPYTTNLNDCSKVTYYWYKFIDQPSIKKFNLSELEKQELQYMAEKTHRNWHHTDEYLAPPTKGTLVSFDDGLLVEPPQGLEIGYVPIVVKQELACALPTKIDLPWPEEENITKVEDKKSTSGGVIGWWLLMFFGVWYYRKNRLHFIFCRKDIHRM